MQKTALYFTGPRQLDVRQMPVRAPRETELLVKTELSAISAGTEMLLYRGEIPANSNDDVDAVSRDLKYPTPYGYAAVGRVLEVGGSLGPEWRNRLVFAFEPHASHFVIDVDSIVAVPEGISSEDAVFLPNMETAVNIVQDASPLLGERVVILGQGIVGLLTAALLAEFPLECLVTVDRFEPRRTASLSAGAAASLDPAVAGFQDSARRMTGSARPGYDIVIELTGNPAGMNAAIDLSSFSGRIVAASWYGTKSAPIELGGRFHRSRVQLIASQVSTIAPGLSGRWTKPRRLQVAWSALRRLRPSKWITHRFPLVEAAEAYRILDQRAEAALQIVFVYP